MGLFALPSGPPRSRPPPQPPQPRRPAGPAPRHPLHKRLPAQAGAPHRCVSKSAGAPPRPLPSARAALKGATASARRPGCPGGRGGRERSEGAGRPQPRTAAPRAPGRDGPLGGAGGSPEGGVQGATLPASRALLPVTALLTGERSPEIRLPARRRQVLPAERCPWGRTSATPWA